MGKKIQRCTIYCKPTFISDDFILELPSKQLIFMIKSYQNHFDITTTGQGMVHSKKYLQQRGSLKPCENLSQANKSWLPYYRTWKG